MTKNSHNSSTKQSTSILTNVYFDYLDALRCLAFLAVFYAHTGTFLLGDKITNAFPINLWKQFTIYGVYGVNFFFVLSGFLITYLLLREKSKPEGISIKRFYFRRIIRIWPVYFATIFITIFILPLIIQPATQIAFPILNTDYSFLSLGFFALFLGNFFTGFDMGFVPFSLNILWSVCIEEQFYLVWPWLVRYLNIRKLALFTCLLISLSFLYKYLYGMDRLANYYITWSVGMDLAFGALLGIFYFKKYIKKIIIYSLSIIAACLGLITIIYLADKSALIEIIRLVKTPIVDCIFMLIILYSVNKISEFNSPNTKLSSKNYFVSALHISKSKILSSLKFLGKISYGLYAYHPACLMLTIQLFFSIGLLRAEIERLEFFSFVIISLSITILVAILSNKYLEKRFLALKDKN